MKVRITYTVEVNEPFLRALGRYHGRKSKATGSEVREWFEQQGQTTDIYEILASRERAADEIIRRNRESDWVFLLETGYAGTAPCSYCGEMKPCRGKRRSLMACHECVLLHGLPKSTRKVSRAGTLAGQPTEGG